MAQQGPQYGDWFNYLNPDSVGGGNFYSFSGDANNGYTFNEQNIPDQYKGVVSGGYKQATGQQDYTFDLSKLPGGGMTKFTSGGKNLSLTDMMTLGSDPNAPDLSNFTGKPGTSGLRDKSQMYYDPNFGWLTPKSNMYNADPKEGAFMKFVDKAAPIIGGIAMMAMGDPMGLAAFNGIKGLESGGNPLAALLSMAGGMSGIPGGGMIGSLLNIGRSGSSTGGNGRQTNTGGMNQQQLLPLLLLLAMSRGGK